MSDLGKVHSSRSLILLASLCLNLLLIATVLVILSRGGGFIAQPGGALAPAAIARGMPVDEQGRIRAIVQSHQEAVRQARQAAQQARREAFRVFAAPSYDAAAFTKALDDVRNADGRLEDQAIARLLDTIATLTPQQRQIVIDRVRTGANQPLWRRLLRRIRNPQAPQVQN